ncbi:MAG: 4-hydroxy-3-methylbut-2-en-1-yl diphosphate synthase [Clostridiales bacterium GWD2_32_19]|nr:MAG: 4-hydroxy-3-methylbut-2-en-1-yl diphosphate synthase [Clostridiales bacterium GWD2_32_19]
MERKQTREVKVGNVFIGGSNQVVIQSMTNTDTRDVIKTVEQIKKLEEAGCEIVRVAVPDMEAAEALREIKNKINIPLVADIHFDYRLALKALENGIDKLRINPGNIGSKEKIKMVVDKAKERKVPIRIGVNSGSIEKDILAKYGKPTPECLVESALRHVQILENYDFTDIIISVKASNVQMCIESYKLMSSKVDYPLHVGVTEAGTVWSGMVKSSVGIGSILSQGIGDTIRVSITCDPVEEIYCAKQILKSLGLRKFGIEIVSCPTCGRTEIDLITLANEVEKACQNINKDLKVAVMGCVVNGPGEAKEADIGVAGGKGVGILFKKGKIYKKVSEDEILAELIKGIREM